MRVPPRVRMRKDTRGGIRGDGKGEAAVAARTTGARCPGTKSTLHL